MTVVRHKKPCSQCPFRRVSCPGWLGASTPEEFMQTTVDAEEHMPCHKTIDYEKKDWQDRLDTASHCAGSLIFLKNNCKRPLDQELYARIQQVERDDSVFSWRQEFEDHHNSLTRRKAN